MKGPVQDKKVAQPMKSIQQMERKREQRRLKMEEYKREKKEKQAYNLACGKNVDVDFQIMIEKNMFAQKMITPHKSSADVKIAVCVRKRPLFKKQEQKGQIDAISCANPQIKIHQPKYRVDGISKYVEDHKFTYDNTFNEQENTSDIYQCSLKPLLPLLISEGIITCFAYGQTGSGKTYTMNELQKLIVSEMFQLLNNGNYQVAVSFFEIYGGRCLDLLNNKQALNILEDEFNHIQIPGLVQKTTNSAEQLLKIMENANIARTTHCTVANDTSSRSHSICQVTIRSSKRQIGKLVLVDLAGSQRAADTQSNNRQRRMQGAEINKSLLALKECIRAMDSKADHVPFRSSKLTLILRNSFLSKKAKSKIVMIACVSPGTSSADHSLNTLRYAARLKDNSKASKKCDQIVLQRKNSSRCQDIEEEIRERVQSNKNESFKTPKLGQKTPHNNKENKASNSNVPNSQKKLPQLPKIKNVSKEYDNKQDFPPVNKAKKPMSAYENLQRYQKPLAAQKEQIEQEIGQKVQLQKKKYFHESPNQLMQTFKGLNDQADFLKFTQKVSNLYEQQQELFAIHMAAMKQDAKMLSKQSDLIGSIKGVGYIDYDIDEYVGKLDEIVEKKLKVYQILSKQLKKFKNSLDQEDQMRKKVNNAIYY